MKSPLHGQPPAAFPTAPSPRAAFSDFENALLKAWERKKALQNDTDCLRLLNAHASGTPRLVFELYGKHAILLDYGQATSWGERLPDAARAWCAAFGWESVSRLDRSVPDESGRTGNHVLTGEPPENLAVRERSLGFRVEPRHPRNVGLFLDTRNLRAELAANCTGARVLNLFCYTGTLGLAPLAGGASEVVQVDISARYLDWGRANLRLNELPEDRCRFVKMDSERYLDWAAKKGLSFDRILLDPPVFSRFEGKVFRWADDYFRLAAKCASLLAPGGTLHAVTNYAGIKPAAFAAELTRVFRDAGLRAAPPRRIALPEDYDLPADSEELPEGNAILMAVRRD